MVGGFKDFQVTNLKNRENIVKKLHLLSDLLYQIANSQIVIKCQQVVATGDFPTFFHLAPQKMPPKDEAKVCLSQIPTSSAGLCHVEQLWATTTVPTKQRSMTAMTNASNTSATTKTKRFSNGHGVRTLGTFELRYERMQLGGFG